jgi:ATP-dependent DNA ligase
MTPASRFSTPYKTTRAPSSADHYLLAIRAQGFEGLGAKRRDSRYEAGERSGAWTKIRVNERQEFVIGGYTVGGRTVVAEDKRVEGICRRRARDRGDS